MTAKGDQLRSKAQDVSDNVLCRIDMTRDEATALRRDIMELVKRIDEQDAAAY